MIIGLGLLSSTHFDLEQLRSLTCRIVWTFGRGELFIA